MPAQAARAVETSEALDYARELMTDKRLPPVRPREKRDKWKCTCKASEWPKGTPCDGLITTAFGRTRDEAYDAAVQACVAAGCNKPPGKCSHVTCFELP